MLIIPPNEMTPEDIKILRENDICVVVAEHPEKIKFVDTIPAASSRNQIENAAIKLTRKLFRGELFATNRKDFANLYIDCLINGTELDTKPTQREEEERIYNQERFDEMRRIAREDARAEKAAVKLNKK